MKLGYIEQLDGLRAFAVLLVCIWHWIPRSSALNSLPNGEIGVVVFYVLSGFLITRILLSSRQDAEASGTHPVFVLRQFLIRRALRIFPLYYLTLSVVLLLPVATPDFRSNAGWYFLYLSNVHFWHSGLWDQGLVFGAHLWSLSVEEQFYLLWPLGLLFLRYGLLPRLLLAATVSGLGFRMLTQGSAWLLMPACLDSFAVGAALAWVCQFRSSWLGRLTRGTMWKFVPILLAAISLTGPGAGWPWAAVQRFLISCLGVVLVWEAQQGSAGILSRVLSHPWAVGVGRVSYGIYVFHEFVRLAYEGVHHYFVSRDLRWPVTDWILLPHWGGGAMFLVYGPITLALASASWHFFERPVNDLRTRFEYAPERSSVEVPAKEG